MKLNCVHVSDSYPTQKFYHTIECNYVTKLRAFSENLSVSFLKFKSIGESMEA